MKDTIGLINPKSIWHNDSKVLRGLEIVVTDIKECIRYPGWYSVTAKLVNPPKQFKVIANHMNLYGVRLRRVK